MDKKLIELHFPMAGVDRSLAYQRQHPYTTPQAINVWPDGQLEGRERGGSRPGVDVYVPEPLSYVFDPVMMLSKVGVQQDLQVKALQTIPMNRILTAIDWETPSWSTGSLELIGEGVRSVNASRASLFSPLQSVQTATTFTILMEIKPVESSEGQYFIYVGQNVSHTAGNTLRLQIASDGTYSGDFTDGANVVTAFSGGTDNSKSGGTFRVQVFPSTNQVRCYWKWHYLGQFTMTTSVARWGFGTQKTSDGGGVVTSFTVQYQSGVKEFTSRRDLLVAICGGDLYCETAPKTLSRFIGAKFSWDRRLQSADYLQKLYIADHGTLITGTTGVLYTPSWTEFKDGSIDWEDLGVDDSYVLTVTTSAYSVNEKQQVELSDVDGGTFKLIYDGAITQAIAWNASTATVETALEELPNIGTVTVTSPVSKKYIIEFDGVNAGLDMQLLDYDKSGLTNSAPQDPSILIKTTQAGRSGDATANSYQIQSVSGDTITLVSGPDLGGYGSNVTGVHYQITRPTRVFDPINQTVEILAATTGKGIAPSGAKLCCLYRDRLVLGNVPDAPYQWFMSRQGDPKDWDYTQTDPGAAVSGSTGRAGTIGDPLTAIIPHSSRCLIMGCYSSLWIMRGDPANGGELDNVSYNIGIVDAFSWCHVPTGELLFLSQDGLYVLPAGCAGVPFSLSRERLPRELVCVDPSQYAVSMVWDTMHRGVHIFLTRSDLMLGSHWFFDWETKSFWEMKFSIDHEPFCAFSHTPLGECQQVLLGCRDSWIRHFSDSYWTDSDGTQIESQVMLGPIKLNNDYRDGVLTEMQIDLARNSGNVSVSVQSGETAEHCYYGSDSDTYEIGELNSWNMRPRVRGNSVIIRLEGADSRPWAYERGLIMVKTAGRRKRSR